MLAGPAKLSSHLSDSPRCIERLTLCMPLVNMQVATGPDARQVSGPATAAQQRNLSLCSLLSEVHIHMVETVAELPPQMDDVVGAGIGAVHGVAMDAVAPLFKVSPRAYPELSCSAAHSFWPFTRFRQVPCCCS